MSQPTLLLGTRGSALALRQAGLIRAELESLGHKVELLQIRTTGDRILDVPLSQIGGKALFTKELDVALLDGSIHLAVHSLKDLPTHLPPGIHIAAVTAREDPRDTFVSNPSYGGTFHDLPTGATLATSSVRRTAQLKAWRPDLNIVPVRGNVDTRLAKLDAGRWQGLILARAGLRRLGLDVRASHTIDTDIMLPAVGQGALAVVCAEGDEKTTALLREALHQSSVWAGVRAERAFLRRLEGGCSVPIGALGRQVDGDKVILEGCVASPDGSQVLRDRVESRADRSEELGTELANMLLARGAGEILDRIRRAEE